MTDPAECGASHTGLAALDSDLTLTALHMDLRLAAGHDVTGRTALVGSALELAGAHRCGVDRRCLSRRRSRHGGGLRTFLTAVASLAALTALAMGFVLPLLRLIIAAAAAASWRIGQRGGGPSQADRRGSREEEITLHVEDS